MSIATHYQSTHPDIALVGPIAKRRDSDVVILEYYPRTATERLVFTHLAIIADDAPVYLVTAVRDGYTVVWTNRSGKYEAGCDENGQQRQRTCTTMEVYVNCDHTRVTSVVRLDRATALELARRVAAGASYVGLIVGGHTVEIRD